MPRLNFEGRRKPECTDVVIAAHAMRENHYATLVHSFENFLRSQNYKISITLLLISYVLERVTSIQVQK